jgi:hypothetical protein
MMKKLSILLSLGIFLVVGVLTASAEDGSSNQGPRDGKPRQELKDLRAGNKDLRMQNQADRAQFKDERKGLLDNFKLGRQDDRAKLKEDLKSASGTEDKKMMREDFMKNRKAEGEAFRAEIKTKREELKTEIKGRHDEIRQRIASSTPEVKKKLDTVKKARFQNLTTNLDSVFKAAITRIKSFNVRIDEVISKLDANGKDTSNIKSLYATAQASMTQAEESANAFAGKVGSLLTGTEASRQAMQTEIEYVRNDIKSAREAYKVVVEAIRETADRGGEDTGSNEATSTNSN